MLGITVHRTRHEGGIGTQGQSSGIERMIDATHRCTLRDLVFFRSRGILSFSQTIDLIIEHQNIHIEVPAKQVDGMISADTQTVSITRDDPYAEIGTRSFQSGSDRRRSSMDRVHPECIHVVRKTAATTDTGNKNNIFPRYPQRGHHFLYLGQDGIIATTRTPTYFLVRGKIFGCQ